MGVPDFAYAGEVALGEVLADPTGELAALKTGASLYPPRLSEALVARLGEATFLVGGARKGADRSDAAYVAGCLFRVVGLCAHAIHGHAGRWLINEKGAVDASGGLPGAPQQFARRAHSIFTNVRPEAAQLNAALDDAQELVDETKSRCAS